MNIFEKVSRLAIRFETSKGNITVEDLWTLPLTSEKGVSLNGVAKAVNKQLKEVDEDNFVGGVSSSDSLLQLKLDIVKHIIQVKLEEREAEKIRASNKQLEQIILEILSNKKDAELLNKTPEELEAILKNLKS